MTEWIAYTGSDEQIAEMQEAQHGVLFKGDTEIYDVSDMVCVDSYIKNIGITHYLICNPHPLANMICQQARTGQPVWVKLSAVPNSIYTHFINTFALVSAHAGYSVYVTNKPDWDIPDAEYSFEPFEVEV